MSLVGKPAPAFTLYDNNRKPLALESLRGARVVVAFFPAAFTGVCEKELCTFRDSLGKLAGLNATIVAISVDGPFANNAFAAKNGITFPILSDFERAATRAWGVELENFAGITGYTAAKRAVFIVSETGTVTYEWVGPNPGVEPDYAAIESALG